MWGWIQPLLSALGWLAKLIWGTDKPSSVEVTDAKPKTPVGSKSDAELLAECGLRDSLDKPKEQ